MVLAAQMCFYNQISQTVKFYVSLRAFKIRTGVTASFNPHRQSEYENKVSALFASFKIYEENVSSLPLFCVAF